MGSDPLGLGMLSSDMLLGVANATDSRTPLGVARLWDAYFSLPSCHCPVLEKKKKKNLL